MNDLAGLYRDIFEADQRGAALLEDLLRRFTRPAVTKGGIDAVIETYRRLGERSVMDHIVRQINIANGIKDDGEQGAQA